MLYTIIPPILIVLSLIGIILLLMKKSKEVAQLPMEEFMIEGVPAGKKAGFFGRVFGKIRWDNIKHFFLAILEKITRKMRVLFLKLESRSANLSNTIRESRKARAEKIKQRVSPQQENDIMKKLRDYKLDSNKKYRSGEGRTFEEIKKTETREKKFFRRAPAEEIEEERTIRPIISEKKVSPRSRTEIRDRLEELLIERIAINPKDSEAYERLGEYYLEIRSYSDSKECFKQVLKLDPKNRNAKYRMRRLENLLAEE